jgi:hypothetical protein
MVVVLAPMAVVVVLVPGGVMVVVLAPMVVVVVLVPGGVVVVVAGVTIDASTSTSSRWR